MIKKERWIPVILIVLLSIQFIPYFVTFIAGEEIQVNVSLYDPRDIFRGDYVAIELDASYVELGSVTHDLNMTKTHFRKPIYVVFAPKGEKWIVEGVFESKPEAGLYLEAQLDFFEYAHDADENHVPIGIHLDFGLERFYVQENLGKAFENLSSEAQLVAVLKVWKGRAVIADLKIE